MSGNGAVTTTAAQADGGNIEITATALVQLRDSDITATVAGGPTTVGGNIAVNGEFILLENSRIVANAFEGQGGNIRLTAQAAVLTDQFSVISASSSLGIDGSVDIRSPATDLTETVTPLTPTFNQAAILLSDRCTAARRGQARSSFVLRGREQLPNEPDGTLPSPVYVASSGTPPPAQPAARQAPAWDDRKRPLQGQRETGRTQVAYVSECARWYTPQVRPDVNVR